MKDWIVVMESDLTHKPLIMRLYLSENLDRGSYIELIEGRDNKLGKIRARFIMRNNKMKALQKVFSKKSSRSLESETGWAEDQVWNYLQEINHMTREAQEALVPDTR